MVGAPGLPLAEDLPKISADAHVDEPHDLWFARMDESLRDRAPRRIQEDADGGWNLVVDGAPVGWSQMSAQEAAEKEAERTAAAAPDVRLQMMRTDGINAEVIYPTIGLYAWNIADPAVGRAACRVYNDWIVERLGNEPRIGLAVMIPTWDVDMAVEEVLRRAGERSVAGLLLPLVGTPEWNLPHWEPLWDVLGDVGKPVVMHQGTGHDMIFYRGWGSATANLLATQSMASRAAALLSCSGVLERHPALHVVLVEVNAGWMAWTMSTLDNYYRDHAHWSKPKLAEPPSHYLRRQVHATFQDDPVALHNIRFTGAGCLLWGNDYPHPESTYPHSNELLDAMLDGVSDHDARAVTSANALRLFGFSDDVLAVRP
ncbi:MAG TPA: amidohydrolase family protein [Acidimicrobiia bacterium]|nr:amidohydrolase family protein [Acidimicrobiia bacterium]